jgi:predicted nucleic acid-binding protein
VIYLDTSVVLATLFNEQRRPPHTLWANQTISSRLLEYEIFARLNALGHSAHVSQHARNFLETVELVDLARPVLERALQPVPVPLRTLDAIHLATLIYLRDRGLSLELATYDKRMGDAALSLGVKLAPV